MPDWETGRIRIRKRGVSRVRSGHLWVYRSDILAVDDVPPGAIATVQDERDSIVGKRSTARRRRSLSDFSPAAT